MDSFAGMRRVRCWLPALLVALAGCTSKAPLDNPSRGDITVAADESFRPLVTQLTAAYSGIYPNAHFRVLYRPEQEAINLMLSDSARIAFVTRKLTPNEQRALDKLKIRGVAEKIGTDGVALIVSRSNTDSLFTMNQLRDVFAGRVRQWSQLPVGNQRGPITLVFDNNNSSNLEFMLRTFGVKDPRALRIFTTRSNGEVVNYVRSHPDALGFIGVNWISDGDEPLSIELARDLRVAGVSAKPNPASRAEYFQPFQEALGMQQYPLRRPVYVLSREAHPGLGGGLINYVARDAGSLIIYKLGLWPAIPYNREVNLKK